MAAIETQSVEQVDKVSLRVLVDKERNRVLYAEAGKDFVDVLFSFLTLPLGTIARLVSKDSNIEAVKFGSISSLYQSVSKFDQQYLWSHTCKEMLLNPRNSMEDYCQKLKLNIDDTSMQYFVCENWDCRRKNSGCRLSIFRNKICYCGKVMNREVFPEYPNLENGFVKKNVVDLLKLSLTSKAALTSFILKKNRFVVNPSRRNNLEFLIGELPSDEDRQISVKVTVQKSDEQILFVEAGDDFVDFVYSFLTFPLGRVLHMLQGFSSLSCIDNLYKSLCDLSPDIYLMSQGLKDKLTKPLIATQFELIKQLLPIGVATLPVNYCHTYYDHVSGKCVLNFTKEADYTHDKVGFPEKFVPLELADHDPSIAKSSFVKGPSTYMVTDSLFVSLMSSISTMLFLKRSKVRLSDLEERVIKIGVKEGLSILKASLTSTSALQCGLKKFIKTVKVEK
ncbi:hypothetical protein MtrunA17_Chr7g0218371 [Medicago truncatula]|uniref:DUF674 family protein n=1 Tax=Medicago truncatula TaxID=3880 RepID=A0A396GV01_MEDTR|nr:hypothetical protein MtrunA17_Chr7g0218371 [Medicago truncatula]